jgi:hypothetical protein
MRVCQGGNIIPKCLQLVRVLLEKRLGLLQRLHLCHRRLGVLRLEGRIVRAILLHKGNQVRQHGTQRLENVLSAADGLGCGGTEMCIQGLKFLRSNVMYQLAKQFPMLHVVKYLVPELFG